MIVPCVHRLPTAVSLWLCLPPNAHVPRLRNQDKSYLILARNIRNNKIKSIFNFNGCVSINRKEAKSHVSMASLFGAGGGSVECVCVVPQRRLHISSSYYSPLCEEGGVSHIRVSNLPRPNERNSRKMQMRNAAS